MDFKEASSAHRDWKIKLRAYVNGTGEALDEATVRREDACQLGKWLVTQGKGGLEPNLQELKLIHARFHQCAGDVVAAAKRGQRDEALRMLDAGTVFADASFKVVGLLARVAGR